jgi:acyl transferase domain-containing protein
MKDDSNQGIAIIGMSGRFPLARSVDEFWRNLVAGVDAIRSSGPDERARTRLGDVLQSPDYVGDGYSLDDIHLFDADFFGFTPAEARITDPQHRVFMECVWEALESAGYIARTPKLRVGLFAGASISHYLQHNLHASLETTRRPTDFLQKLIGNDKDYLATHVAYKLNLRGPSVGVQTACSTSLVALWLACQSLSDYQCDLAVAGGVTIKHATHSCLGYMYEQGNILSPDGHCRPFDASAAGTAFGSGAGVVVLKRLDEALAERDVILAVVKESAVNNDGAVKMGFTAPSLDGQAEVISLAHAMAGVHPDTITYIEAHGTGTPLGDPIEVAALTKVFRAKSSRTGYCAIGSVKSNVGHLESAAGMAGLIKTVLALQHRQIPPSLHFEKPNPQIDFASSPFYVNTTLADWPDNGVSARRAGVSSFGIGGTNAHVVLEEAPTPAPRGACARPQHVLTMSAADPTALHELAGRYVEFLASEPDLHDVAFTSNTGRRLFPHRLAVLGSAAADVKEALTAFLDGRVSAALVAGEVRADAAPNLAYLFTGQGSQFAAMGRQLYETSPVFRQTLDRSAEIVRPQLDRSLLDVMFDADESILRRTVYTQPALFALEYSLAQVWNSWGIRPTAVAGHSVGEYVAACIAGVFSLEDGLKLIAARGRLMQALPAGGDMIAVFADEPRVQAAVARASRDVAIAAVNGPQHIVVSGRAGVLAELLAPLAADGVRMQPLSVSHAFHSPLMHPMLPEFRRVAATISYRPPVLPIVSNVTGEFGDARMASAEYWTNHVVQPVRFARGMHTLDQSGCRAFLETGPQPVLLGMGRQCLPGEDRVWLPSLRRGQPDWIVMLRTLAQLYALGAKVDWDAFDRPYTPRRISQPTYPFQRKEYWIDEPDDDGEAAGPRRRDAHPLLGEPIRLARSTELRFESRIGRRRPAFLDEHRVFGDPVMPLTAYLEMGLAAGRHAVGADRLVLEDVIIHQALVLPESGDTVLQTVLTPVGSSAFTFEIFSLDSHTASATASWTLQIGGRVRAAASTAIPASRDLRALHAEMMHDVPVASYYAGFAERGLRYGKSFQAIRQLQQGASQSLAEISLEEAGASSAESFLVSPLVLDACLQAAAAAQQPVENADTYLPIGIARLELFARPTSSVWSYATLEPRPDGETEPPAMALDVCDPSGRLIVHVDGFSVRRVTKAALSASAYGDPKTWLYHVAWRPQARARGSAVPPATWLIVGRSSGLDSALRTQLQARAHQSLLVEDSVDVPEGTAPIAGVVVLLDGVTAATDADVSAADVVLSALQRWRHPRLGSAHLWLVTCGAQAVGDRPAPLELAQSTVHGLARVIALERPELHCRTVDLDPARPQDEANELAEELLNAGADERIAFRVGTRYVARLQRWREDTGSRLTPPEGAAFELGRSESGILENMALRPVPRRRPGAGEVEIEVRASGLNFRDVLHALGLLGATGVVQPLGSECAGTVAAVGDGVHTLHVGDEVVALANGTMASRVIARAELTFRKLETLTVEESAAVPIVFLTAWYGLHHFGRMRRGDRILIHAAAGGVGQAAIQLARHAGAEIFGTASPAKWPLLEAAGVQHVMSSRTLEFADHVLSVTGGEGVDIVLNSLSGDFIDRSLRVLRPGGRFLEIGKTATWSAERVRELRPDVSYVPFDIAAEMVRNPIVVRTTMEEILNQFREGLLTPPPIRLFPIQEAPAAFRLMAEGKHVGKLVLSLDNRGNEPIRRDGTYLVTGGLGALGISVAGWMARRGAARLVLCGRTAPSIVARRTIEDIERAGCRVDVVETDVADSEAVDRLIGVAHTTNLPLRGIVHAAGVLDDAGLADQTKERMRRVTRPKVDGAWNLHAASRHCPLDFFACFSSTASTFGGAGQANYAAANAFLDALAHHRHAMGLPALTINWGPWAGIGMAARLGDEGASRRAARGIGDIPPDRGVAILEQLLADSRAVQVTVAPIDWQRLLGQRSGLPPFFEAFASASCPAGEVDLVAELEQSPPVKRRSLLTAYVTSQLARALGSDAGIGPHERFIDRGIDSLIAIELRNRLQADLRRPLSQTVIFDYPTLRALVDHIERDVLRFAEPAALEAEPAAPENVADTGELLADLEIDPMLDAIGLLSDSDVQERLAASRDAAKAS